MHGIVDFVAQYLIYLVLVAAAVTGLTVRGPDRWRLVVQTVLGFIALGILVEIANHAYHDTRPFVRLHTRPWFSHGNDNGFPSDHTVVASLIAFLIWPYRRAAGAVLFICALAIGTARVVAQVHSPQDIAGAVVIALVAAVIGWYAGRAVFDRWVRPRYDRWQAGRGGAAGQAGPAFTARHRTPTGADPTVERARR